MKTYLLFSPIFLLLWIVPDFFCQKVRWTVSSTHLLGGTRYVSKRHVAEALSKNALFIQRLESSSSRQLDVEDVINQFEIKRVSPPTVLDREVRFREKNVNDLEGDQKHSENGTQTESSTTAAVEEYLVEVELARKTKGNETGSVSEPDEEHVVTGGGKNFPPKGALHQHFHEKFLSIFQNRTGVAVDDDHLDRDVELFRRSDNNGREYDEEHVVNHVPRSRPSLGPPAGFELIADYPAEVKDDHPTVNGRGVKASSKPKLLVPPSKSNLQSLKVEKLKVISRPKVELISKKSNASSESVNTSKILEKLEIVTRQLSFGRRLPNGQRSASNQSKPEKLEALTLSGEREREALVTEKKSTVRPVVLQSQQALSPTPSTTTTTARQVRQNINVPSQTSFPSHEAFHEFHFDSVKRPRAPQNSTVTGITSTITGRLPGRQVSSTPSSRTTARHLSTASPRSSSRPRTSPTPAVSRSTSQSSGRRSASSTTKVPGSGSVPSSSPSSGRKRAPSTSPSPTRGRPPSSTPSPIRGRAPSSSPSPTTTVSRGPRPGGRSTQTSTYRPPLQPLGKRPTQRPVTRTSIRPSVTSSTTATPGSQRIRAVTSVFNGRALPTSSRKPGDSPVTLTQPSESPSLPHHKDFHDFHYEPVRIVSGQRTTIPKIQQTVSTPAGRSRPTSQRPTSSPGVTPSSHSTSERGGSRTLAEGQPSPIPERKDALTPRRPGTATSTGRRLASTAAGPRSTSTAPTAGRPGSTPSGRRQIGAPARVSTLSPIGRRAEPPRQQPATTARSRSPASTPSSRRTLEPNVIYSISQPTTPLPHSTMGSRPGTGIDTRTGSGQGIAFPPHKAFHDFHFESVKRQRGQTKIPTSVQTTRPATRQPGVILSSTIPTTRRTTTRPIGTSTRQPRVRPTVTSTQQTPVRPAVTSTRQPPVRPAVTSTRQPPVRPAVTSTRQPPVRPAVTSTRQPGPVIQQVTEISPPGTRATRPPRPTQRPSTTSISRPAEQTSRLPSTRPGIAEDRTQISSLTPSPRPPATTYRPTGPGVRPGTTTPRMRPGTTAQIYPTSSPGRPAIPTPTIPSTRDRDRPSVASTGPPRQPSDGQTVPSPPGSIGRQFPPHRAFHDFHQEPIRQRRPGSGRPRQLEPGTAPTANVLPGQPTTEGYLGRPPSRVSESTLARPATPPPVSTVTLSRPTSSATPSRPTAPVTPSRPTAPITPSRPTAPVTSLRPVAPVTLSRPIARVTPSRPTLQVTPSRPAPPIIPLIQTTTPSVRQGFPSPSPPTTVFAPQRTTEISSLRPSGPAVTPSTGSAVRPTLPGVPSLRPGTAFPPRIPLTGRPPMPSPPPRIPDRLPPVTVAGPEVISPPRTDQQQPTGGGTAFPPHRAFHDFHFEPVRSRPPSRGSLTPGRPGIVSPVIPTVPSIGTVSTFPVDRSSVLSVNGRGSTDGPQILTRLPTGGPTSPRLPQIRPRPSVGGPTSTRLPTPISGVVTTPIVQQDILRSPTPTRPTLVPSVEYVSPATQSQPTSPRTPPSIVSTRPSPPTTIFRPSPPITIFRPSPPTTSFRPSPPTTSFRPSPPTTSFRPSRPTTSFRPSPPTTSFRPSPPTTSFRPSSPAIGFRPSPPTTSVTRPISQTPTSVGVSRPPFLIPRQPTPSQRPLTVSTTGYETQTSSTPLVPGKKFPPHKAFHDFHFDSVRAAGRG